MTEYLYPGVYIEEVGASPAPIEGVGTSTAGFVGLTERGPTEPRLITSWFDFERWYGGMADPGTHSYLPFAARGFFENGGRRVHVARVHRSDAGASTITLPTGAGNLVLIALGVGDLNNRIFAWVGPATSTDPDRFRLILLYYRSVPGVLPLVDPLNPANAAHPDRVEPDLVEDFDDLETNGDPATATLNKSTLMTGVFGPAIPSATGIDNSGNRIYLAAAGGSDGVEALTLNDFTGIPSTPTTPGTGLNGLAAIDEISLLSVPEEGHDGIAATVRAEIREAVVFQCEQMKDRFGILQLTRDAGNGIPENVTAPVNTSYAAVYYPWVRVLDPLTDETYLVPPGGHIAGVYARTDAELGVHKAPANEVVRGIIDDDLPGGLGPLAVTVTKVQHDILNSRGVNVIRDFRPHQRGVRVWGARTLSTDVEWKYITVRRLLIFLEESIDKGTRWAVFEPNDEPAWARIRNEVYNFLTTVWRTGALMGAKTEEAFFVKCDVTTMTQDDLDQGRLVGIVGVAPIRPAEFIVFRFSQKTLEAP